jgi:peptidoglycan hydrolase-like protein with peptidoglycan-binding domain
MTVFKPFAAVLAAALFVGAVPTVQAQNIFDVFVDAIEDAQRTNETNQPRQRQTPNGVDYDLMAVQEKLNALGYDAGTADGVMGSKTRTAIAAFQRSIGAPATGNLSDSDHAALFGIEAYGSGDGIDTAAQPGISAGQFQMLYDTDLPYGDFRSGMSDPRLWNIDLESCNSECVTDPQCRAFTFNSQARVCFLKSVVPAASPFNGAISGIKGGDTFGGAPTMAEANRPLTRFEIARVQTALNDLGYDAGTPDGIIGAKTRQAAAQYAAANPGVLPSLDLALMQSVLGLPAATPGSSTGTFNSAMYGTAEEMEPSLALIATALSPSLLTDATVERWYLERYRSSYSDASGLDDAYNDANTVQKQKIIADFREVLLAEANAFVSDPNNQQLHFKVNQSIGFGEFDPAQGIAIRGLSDLYANKRVGEYVVPPSAWFEGSAIDLPYPKFVPITVDSEASDFLDRIRNSPSQRAEIVAWLTLSEFGGPQQGAGIVQPDRIPMTVTVDRVTIVTPALTGNNAAPEETAFVLYDGASKGPAAPTGNPDSVMVAQQLGLPVVDGHVLMPGTGSNYHYWPEQVFGVTDFMATVQKFIGLAGLPLLPEQGLDALSNDFLVGLMSTSQRIRIYGGEGSNNYGLNEFEQRRALNTLKSEVIPELLASAPRFPIPVVSIWPVALGEYDFGAAAFPIAYGDEPRLLNLPENLAGIYLQREYHDLPQTQPMDELSAEQMVLNETSGYSRPMVYIATFGTLEASLGAEGEPAVVSFTAERSGMFADVNLTQLLQEIDASPPQESQAPEARPETSDEIALRSIVAATEVELLSRAYRLLGDDTAADPIFRYSDLVDEANEFEVEAARAEVGKILGNTPERDVWLAGHVVLGTYDLTAGSFPIVEWQTFAPPSNGDFNVDLYITAADQAVFSRPLNIDEATARMIAELSSRELPMFARIKLLDVTLVDEGGDVNVTFGIEFEEIVIWANLDGDDSVPVIVGRLAGSPEPQPGAAPPPVRFFDQESLDYIRIKYAPETIGEGDHHRMMAGRWALEQSGTIPAEERFFPPGTRLDTEALRDRWADTFASWAESRAQALPDTLTLSIPDLRSSCVESLYGHSTSPANTALLPLYPDLAEAKTIEDLERKFAEPHETGPVYFQVKGYLFEKAFCSGEINISTSEALGYPGMEPTGAIIMVDSIPLPGMTASGGLQGIELELEILGVEAVPVNYSPNPVLAIRAALVGGSVQGAEYTFPAGPSELDAIRTAAAAGTELPDGWDIVGLTPGMLLADAEAAIRAHMDVAAVFVRTPGERTEPIFLNERVFVSRALNEAISLTWEPGPEGEVVYAISRKLGQQSDTMPIDALITSLIDKYGDARTASNDSGRFAISWHSQDVPRTNTDVANCTVAQPSSWEKWTLIEGDVDSVPGDDHLQVRGYPWLPGPRDVPVSLIETAALDCGVAVYAEKHVSGNSDHFIIQIIDYPAYMKAFAAAQAAAAAPDPTPEKEAEAEKPKLGFSL